MISVMSNKGILKKGETDKKNEPSLKINFSFLGKDFNFSSQAEAERRELVPDQVKQITYP